MRQLGAKVIITPKEGERAIDSFIFVLCHPNLVLILFCSRRCRYIALCCWADNRKRNRNGRKGEGTRRQARMVSLPPGKRSLYTS